MEGTARTTASLLFRWGGEGVGLLPSTCHRGLEHLIWEGLPVRGNSCRHLPWAQWEPSPPNPSSAASPLRPSPPSAHNPSQLLSSSLSHGSTQAPNTRLFPRKASDRKEREPTNQQIQKDQLGETEYRRKKRTKPGELVLISLER